MEKNAKEVVHVKPKIVELSETNDIYMTLTMCILTNQPNLNDLRFTNDYIEGIVSNKDHFIGIPLVVNREKLENGSYSKLTHELDKKTGQLKTDTIGAFTDFWSEADPDNEEIIKLMGTVRVYKRYPNVCIAMLELYESEDLEFSCEVYVYGYNDDDEEASYRSVDYTHDSNINSLIGSCVVSNPAEVKSKASLLIAEALNKDIEGGAKVADITPETVVFNKGHEIKYHGNLEVSALKWTDVSNQIYNILNPINPKTNYRSYNYYIVDTYTEYVIVEDWDDYYTLYRIGYTIENDMVTIEDKEKWIKGYKGFIPEGIDIDALLAEKEILTAEINKLEVAKKEELLTMENQNTEKVTDLETKIAELETKVTELNQTIVSQQEKITAHESKEVELNGKIEELAPFKEKVETAEKEKKQSELSEKYGKLVSEDTVKSDEFKTAIAELNETKLNEIVVSEVLKQKVKPEDNSETVVVAARKDKELIPESVLQKYDITN